MKEIHKKIISSSFSILLATETSWDESVRSEEIFGNSFNVYRDDRDFLESGKKSGGGVLVAISTKFNSELLHSTKNNAFEHVWVKTYIAGETHVFASVYFPPDRTNKSSYENFFEMAEKILSELPPEVKVHIYGDFNQRNADFIHDSENDQILLPIVGENEKFGKISRHLRSTQLGHRRCI